MVVVPLRLPEKSRQERKGGTKIKNNKKIDIAENSVGRCVMEEGETRRSHDHYN